MQYQVDPTSQTQENGYFRNENQTKSIGSSKKKIRPQISRERNKILTCGFFLPFGIVLLYLLAENEPNR